MKALIKSALVEAFKYDGDLKGSDGKYYAPDWIIKPFRQQLIKIREETGELVIYAKDRYLTAKVGDYVIKDSDGDIYPCSAYMFNKMYVSLDDDMFNFTHNQSPEYQELVELCKPIFTYLNKMNDKKDVISITSYQISVIDTNEVFNKMQKKAHEMIRYELQKEDFLIDGKYSNMQYMLELKLKNMIKEFVQDPYYYFYFREVY